MMILLHQKYLSDNRPLWQIPGVRIGNLIETPNMNKMILSSIGDHLFENLARTCPAAVVHLHFLPPREPQKFRERELRKKGRLIEFQRPSALIFPPGNHGGRRAVGPSRPLSGCPEVMIVGRG